MIIKHATREQLQEALDKTNQNYDGNVGFDNICPNGKHIRMTLRVANSRGKGARLGFTGRHLINACWHAHGDFFDKLLEIDPDAVIKTATHDIYCNDLGVQGNWQDRNIGSMMRPLYFSEACEC